jgi:hypothetical protein
MLDSGALSESVKLAVAPVFLLTAVASMIGALTQRLARVVDRARTLHQELARRDLDPTVRSSCTVELRDIAKRGRLINLSMVFLVICALMIGLTVLELFLAETVSGQLLISKLVLYTFIGGIASFILALMSLLIEVLIASYSIRWKPLT